MKVKFKISACGLSNSESGIISLILLIIITKLSRRVPSFMMLHESFCKTAIDS